MRRQACRPDPASSVVVGGFVLIYLYRVITFRSGGT